METILFTDFSNTAHGWLGFTGILAAISFGTYLAAITLFQFGFILWGYIEDEDSYKACKRFGHKAKFCPTSSH